MGILHSKKSKDKATKNKEKKNKKGAQDHHSENGGAAPSSPVSTQGPGDSGGSLLSNKIRVKALYKFVGMSEDDLPFEAGDKLEVDQNDLSNPDNWWLAKHIETRKTGYIPGNYVVKDDTTAQSQTWWFQADRREAEKLLLLPGNQSGTFLVRSSKEGDSFALSVLAIDPTNNEPSVRHYRIKSNPSSEGVFISPSRPFKDLFDLVEFYKSRDATGLCCPLTSPCARIRPNVQWRELEVKRDAIVLTSKLGAGFFGEVWKGKFRKVVDVAVKTLKPGTMTADQFLGEAKIMHTLTHHRLVQLVAVVSHSEPFLIITELMTNGSLLDFLHSEKGKELKLPHLIEMNSQISEGMMYLETQKFVHRDLRAANILVGEQFDVRIADFGLARVLDTDEIYGASENTKFPVKWTAPEAATLREFSVKSDVWSFGVLMYEIITFGRTPYPGMNGGEVVRMVEQGKRMDKPRGQNVECPDEYYEMMLKCWRQHPEDRPTFESIFDFFSSYSINIEEQYKEADGM